MVKHSTGKHSSGNSGGKSGQAAFAADYAGAVLRPSPNFGERAAGKTVSMLILHYTAMESAEAAETLLTDPKSELSAHYLVRRDGTVVQMVAESKRAWHAGRSFWQGERDINSCSVGIEIDNYGHNGGFPPYPDAQIAAVIALSADICRRHGIAPRHVLAHSDIAPERKNDPGAHFPWGPLAKAGVGLYAPPAKEPPASKQGAPKEPHLSLGAQGKPVEAYQSMLALYGYNCPATGIFDTQTQAATTAFQLHFRPQKTDGAADFATLEALRRLLELAEAG